MIFFTRLFRLIQINYLLARYAANRSVLRGCSWWLWGLSYLNPFSFLQHGKTRGESIRLALESLGPIFVKFGQILSTRYDLFPEDIVEELSKLQDQVPPFEGERAVSLIEASLGCPLQVSFSFFNKQPLASASIAQVHEARLHDGTEVVVKVLRPQIDKVIRKDIALLYYAAKLVQKFWSQSKQLRPVELVEEFEETLLGELDLVREAASASQLRRNFIESNIIYVPKIFWPYTTTNILVMERVRALPIAQLDELKKRGVNMEKLAQHGVTIFFTQVFRDSFFHADMHPGNLFVDISDPENPKYIGVDFGIMGTLSPDDQYYLAENILAFFHRDYRRIAVLHVESGWVAPDTRIDQFESAIRTVSEPIFEMPLSQISFSTLLLKLFQTAKRFNMKVQPQLMLLQKTLFNVEGLGRRLYPDLDLWKTAKPFMEKWSKKQRSVKTVVEHLRYDLHSSIEDFFKTPRLAYDVLSRLRQVQQRRAVAATEEQIPQRERSRAGIVFGVGGTLFVLSMVAWLFPHALGEQVSSLKWWGAGVGIVLMAWPRIFS